METLRTPLIRQMDRFARQISLDHVRGLGRRLRLCRAWRGYAVADAFMAVVGLAVAVIPEGLPAVMTITLAIGVQRMAARHADRPPAAGGRGAGLGQHHLLGQDRHPDPQRDDRAGDSDGRRARSRSAASAMRRRRHHRSPAARSTPPPAAAGRDRAGGAAVQRRAAAAAEGGDWLVEGDPMEGALLVLGSQGRARSGARAPACCRASDEIPFDARHRFMATLHRRQSGAATVYLKGAPERLLGMCRAAARRRPARSRWTGEYWHRQIEALAGGGQRVLGVASLAVPGPAPTAGGGRPRGRLTFLGLLGLIDPPRAEAIAAVRDCRLAGIAVKMITGDHLPPRPPSPASSELADDPQVIAGPELDRLDEAGPEPRRARRSPCSPAPAPSTSCAWSRRCRRRVRWSR